jgi:hypothetical protein
MKELVKSNGYFKMRPKLLALILFLLPLNSFGAGWVFTNTWDVMRSSAEEWDRQCFSNVVEALTERSMALPSWATNVFSLDWYRNWGGSSENATNLFPYPPDPQYYDKDHVELAKKALYGMILNQYWIKKDDWTGNITNAAMYWTPQSIIVHCEMPSNWWWYTPYRSLNGYGAFTNDATVGHNHGYTNEYTVMGGTNFPSGRSTWYTTDYGLQGFKNILNELVWRRMDYNDVAMVLPAGVTNNYVYGYGLSNNWAGAKSFAEASHASSTNTSSIISEWNYVTYGAYDDVSVYEAWITTAEVRFRVASPAKTNLSYSILVYLWAEKWLYGSSAVTFNNNGFPLSEKQFSLFDTVVVTKGDTNTYFYSDVLGDHNTPIWCNTPIAATNTATGAKIIAGDYRESGIIKYDTSVDGFKYK